MGENDTGDADLVRRPQDILWYGQGSAEMIDLEERIALMHIYVDTSEGLVLFQVFSRFVHIFIARGPKVMPIITESCAP